MIKKLILLCIFILAFGCVPVLAADNDYKYAIDVDVTGNQVMVYEKDTDGNYTVPYKTFVCSTGTDTPTSGTYYTSDKYVWRPLFGNVYGQYATRITGSILFHSVPYLQEDKSTLEYEEYNKLGESASLGCVRLSVADAKWIYDNCPSGTRVRMIYSADMPLEKPEAIKIDITDTKKRGWDPTDPDEKNPWLKAADKKAAIEKADPAKAAVSDNNDSFESKTIFVYSGKSLFKASVLENDGLYYASMRDILDFLKEAGIKTDTSNVDGNGFSIALDKTCTVSDEELNRIISENISSGQKSVLLCLNGKKIKTKVYNLNGKNMFNLNSIISMADLNVEEKDGKIILTSESET